ncbi:MAG: hypothetical protein JXR78_17780 [Victivallales bacterium]|nr:hypothetical protein [Victivallales bacterium]
MKNIDKSKRTTGTQKRKNSRPNGWLTTDEVDYDKNNGQLKSVFAVGSQKAAEKLKRQVEKTHDALPKSTDISVISPENYALLQQLADMGVITINTDNMTKLFETENVIPQPPSLLERRLALSRPALGMAERQLKMASVLQAGGFTAEAAAPAKQSIQMAGLAIYFHIARNLPQKAPDKLCAGMVKDISESGRLNRQSLLLLQTCLPEMLDIGGTTVEDASEFFTTVTEFVNCQVLN